MLHNGHLQSLKNDEYNVLELILLQIIDFPLALYLY
jgi:hypothetical protein